MLILTHFSIVDCPPVIISTPKPQSAFYDFVLSLMVTKNKISQNILLVKSEKFWNNF